MERQHVQGDEPERNAIDTNDISELQEKGEVGERVSKVCPWGREISISAKAFAGDPSERRSAKKGQRKIVLQRNNRKEEAEETSHVNGNHCYVCRKR